MSYQTDLNTEAFVKKVRETLQIPCPISDMEALITNIGGTILSKDKGMVYLPTVVKTGDDSFDIIPARETLNRTFELAYALGTLCLVMHFHSKDDTWKNSPATVKLTLNQAQDVRNFACELLMPKQKIIQKGNEFAETTENTDELVEKLAEYFHVNTILAYKRAKPLKILRKRKKKTDKGENIL